MKSLHRTGFSELAGSRPPFASFFDALANEPDRARWDAVFHGLAALRLVDASESGTAAETLGLARVVHAVEMLGSGKQKEALADLLRALESPWTTASSEIVDRLFDYALALHYDAEWELSIDAYQSVLRHAGQRVPVATQTWFKLGMVYLDIRRMRSARTAFNRCREESLSLFDVEGELLAEEGLTHLARDRGNIPLAKLLLDQLLLRARRLGSTWMEGRTRMNLGTIYFRQGDFHRSMEEAFASISVAKFQLERDRAEMNIGTCLLSIGAIDAARVVLARVSTQSVERRTREFALVNLLHIAMLRRDRHEISRVDRLMQAGLATPELTTLAYIGLAEAHHVLDDDATAHDFARRAQAIATEHGFNEWIIKSDLLLGEIPRHPPQIPEMHVSGRLKEIVDIVVGRSVGDWR